MGKINSHLTIKLSIFCLYLSVAYWVSLHFPPLGMMFYPSLGSFSVILMNHNNYYKNLLQIVIGATITSTIGSVLYFVYPSIFSFFITAFITLWVMQKNNWNAAPILAVALIPFFSNPQSVWVLPLSVLCSLIGLSLPLWIAQKLDRREEVVVEERRMSG